MSDEPTLRSLFDAVADLPPAEREAALRARTGDNELVEKVLRLCRHASTDHTYFADSISANAVGFGLAAGDTVAVGDTLDAWQLTKKIGEGGMGAVFLAARSDGHFQQNVAIKVIHGLPTAAAKARLAQERQILAGLTHPNIARLFDGGATPNGQPYLVMEHIEGVAIDTWCGTAGGGFRAVLALLLPICDAVHVAHQRLIVHCDIKPANILVTTAGRPVLLDFGIASLLGDTAANEILHDGVGDRSDKKITRSIVGKGAAVACTPRYASPEQKAGGVITTASDIFSLGRVLAQLCEADPIFAASGATHLAVGTTRLKAREVRAIIAKACNERPDARYGSAMALAADIKRVLDGVP